MPSSLRSSTKWFVDFETPPDSPSTCGWVDNKHSFWGWNYPLNQHKSEKDTILTLFAAATTQSRCIYTVIFPLLRRGWWSVKGGEGSFSSETWNAPLKKALSLSLSLSLFLWHCTSRASTDWESHMAGNKPRAGFMSTLCHPRASCHLI